MDKERLDWLKSQVRSAALQTIAISVLIFGGLGYQFLRGRGWESYVAFAVGLVMGALAGTHHQGNPLRFAPLIRRSPLPVNEEEAKIWLTQYWGRFPRYYCWIANVPYIAVLLVMALSASHGVYESLGLYLRAILIRVILGFFPGVFLCLGVFFVYVLHTWRED